MVTVFLYCTAVFYR